VHSGVVDGLRIDHIDGLADPKGYLDHLRQQAGPDCYITVEKILADGEQLPQTGPSPGPPVMNLSPPYPTRWSMATIWRP
jgi:(1->4)-alpha-D-glucan 1-alpha-D-glucosylmutase